MKTGDNDGIQPSFDLTLKDTNLENLAIDAGELAIDSLFDDGILREIPIVSTLVGLAKFGANIQDRLFLKKILTFLSPLNNISAGRRKKMINEIDSSKKYRVKVGEKLLYIIDTCHDYETSELVGVLFKTYIEGKITYEDFLKAAIVLGKIDIDDFRWFIKARKYYHFDLDEAGHLISSGLFDLHYEQIGVDIKEKANASTTFDGKRKGEYETDVSGGIDVNLTKAGQVILEVFSGNYKRSEPVRI